MDVGYERFLGPEIFFNPAIYSQGGLGLSGVGLEWLGGRPGAVRVVEVMLLCYCTE